jgi:hypothetical protein
VVFLKKTPSITKNSATKPFILNMLFEKENETAFTKNSVLSRNILEYLFEKEGNKPFRFTDLGKYLMKKNYEFRDYYTDHLRNVTMSNRIANHRQRIQRCIDNLIDSQLLIIKDKVKSEKNELQTPLYAFSLEGIIVALLCRYHNISSDKYKDTRRRIEDQVFSIIFHLFSQYNSHIVDFVSKIYLKAKEKGFSESIVLLLLKILKDSNIQIRYMKDALNWALYFHLEKSQRTKRDFFNIYIETLNELDENIRKIILYHEKGEIESRFHLYQPPKDWEEMWTKNIQEYSKLVLYGTCQNQACLNRCPLLVDYYDYRTEIFLKGHLKGDCDKCNSRDSFYVYDTLEKKEIQAKLV